MKRPARPPDGRGVRAGTLLFLAPITLFYAVFMVVPYLIVLRLSFFRFSATRLYLPEFTLANYAAIVTDPFYLALMARTVGLGLLVTLICLLLGFPLAIKITRSNPAMKSVLIAITLSPLLINLVVRSYAWLVVLGDSGIVNTWLRAAGLIQHSLPLSGNTISVLIGLTHIGLPLMVLSLMSVLERMDPALVDAAESLGASPARVLRRIVLPASVPGIGAGSLLVFSFTVSAFITPALLGGNRVSTISTLIYDKFIVSANWPVGATLVMVLLVINLAVIVLHGRLFREH